MDRNLGATTTYGEGQYGLLYQWGRKDPFLGIASTRFSMDIKYVLSTNSSIWKSVNANSSNCNVAYTIANPTTLLNMAYGSSGSWSEVSNLSNPANSLWQPTKTIYDPCPPGYRVPDGGKNGVWAKALGEPDYLESDYNLFNESYSIYDFSNKNTTAQLTTESSCVYPAAGYMQGPSFVVDGACMSGACWSCTPAGALYAYAFWADQGTEVYPSSDSAPELGLSVRCQKQ